MRKDKVIVLFVFLLAVAAVAGFQALRASAEKNGKDRTAASRPSLHGEFRGICLQLHNSDPEHPYEKLIDEIAAAGANAVKLVVTGWQENCSSTSIFIDVRKGPSPQRLRGLIAYAKKKGLCVVLMPIVLLENGRENEWRGKIGPEKWDDWWQRYNAFILHFARLAQEGGADVFMVGSELVSTEKQADRWRGLIAEVRKVFTGRLSYSANWDHYRPIEWWDDLDIIGMTTYYDLTGGKEPTVERLLEAWKPIKKDILEWQAKVNRPILFTEVGWPNQVTAAQFPWDYYRSQDKPDPKAQANCFEAFFRTWADEPSTAGYLVWEWRSSLDHDPDPNKDTSYFPEGKPAMAVIKKYFQHAAKPAPDPRATARVAPDTQPAEVEED